jgi:hypothetical protein
MKTIRLTALAAVVIGITFSALPSHAQHGVNHAYFKVHGEELFMLAGDVVSISTGAITLKPADGKQVTYKIDSGTKFFKDKTITPSDPRLGQGQKIMPKDIKNGDKAAVIANSKGTALEIAKGGVFLTL